MPHLPELKDSALTLEGGVATLTFKRDDVRNALTSSELVVEIPRVIAWATATREVSVLILTGEGSAFSAGGNIKTMGQRAKGPAFELQQNYRRGIQAIPLALDECDVPVIAAVNGPALGGGNELALACTFVVAEATASFGQPEINQLLLKKLRNVRQY